MFAAIERLVVAIALLGGNEFVAHNTLSKSVFVFRDRVLVSFDGCMTF